MWSCSQNARAGSRIQFWAWAARRRAPQGRRAAETPQENRPITLAEAVITNQQDAALDLARRSGVSWRADNLEGIVQRGDWQNARRLARQRWLEAVARPAGLPLRTGPEVKVVTRPAVCKSLGRGVYELPPVLPRTLCASVADEVKQRVKEGKWKSMFTKIPTRDVPVAHLAAREDLYRAIDASCHLVTLCTGQEVTYLRRLTGVTVYDSATEDTCCVCLETLKLDACLRPCQHMMCDTCARKVDKCPLCRERVVKVDSAANFSGMPMHLMSRARAPSRRFAQRWKRRRRANAAPRNAGAAPHGTPRHESSPQPAARSPRWPQGGLSRNKAAPRNPSYARVMDRGPFRRMDRGRRKMPPTRSRCRAHGRAWSHTGFVTSRRGDPLRGGARTADAGPRVTSTGTAGRDASDAASRWPLVGITWSNREDSDCQTN